MTQQRRRSDVKKNDIVAEVRRRTKVEDEIVSMVIDTAVEVIIEEVAKDQDVYIRFLGRFTRYKQAAKERQHFHGKFIAVPAKHRVRFKPSLTFKRAIQEDTKPEEQ